MTALNSGDKEAIKKYIQRVFGKQAKLATAIFTAESGLRCDAIGDGHIAYFRNGTEYGKSYGIAQIRHLEGRPSPEQLTQCKFNIDYAYKVYDRSGFKPWSAYTNKAYLRFY